MKAINIEWDVESKEILADLPTEIDIPEGMTDEDEISDYISEETGFCHMGFELVDDEGNEVDLDDDFLTSLADETAGEEQIEIWLDNLLEATGKTSVGDLTATELLHEMDEVMGTIRMEKVWAISDETHEENIRHNVAYLKKLADLLSVKLEDVVKSFECEEDLSQYTDSMLYDSNTTIAHLECETGNGTTIEMDLMVRGHVKVEYRGDTYKMPSGFPESLKRLIKKFPNEWNLHRNIYISENNWFEYIYTVTKDDESYSDGIMFESDLSEYSSEKLKTEMLGLCAQIVAN